MNSPLPSLTSIIHAANDSLIARGELGAVDRFFTRDYVVHFTDTKVEGGHEVIGRMVGGLHKAFSDLTVEVQVLVEGDGRIAWQRTMRGTQTGAFKGFPATGKGIVWRDMVASEFRDGKIAREWVVTDLAERLLLARKR